MTRMQNKKADIPSVEFRSDAFHGGIQNFLLFLERNKLIFLMRREPGSWKYSVEPIYRIRLIRYNIFNT